jgi:hypothetical protein
MQESNHSLDVLVVGELQAILDHQAVLRITAPMPKMSAGYLWGLIRDTAVGRVSGDAAIQQVLSVMKVAALAVDEEVVDSAEAIIDIRVSTVAVLPPLSGG